MEIWRKIKGYSSYMVSNYGNVKTMDYNHTGQEKQLKTFINSSGYVACNLMQNGVRKRMLVHRLVAVAFIPNYFNLETVNHKDGKKTNNNECNLEWMSVADNLRHGHKNGFVKYSSGENHYAAKLSTKEVKEIKSLLQLGIKGRVIASMFGVDEKFISAIKTKRTRKHE